MTASFGSRRELVVMNGIALRVPNHFQGKAFGVLAWRLMACRPREPIRGQRRQSADSYGGSF